LGLVEAERKPDPGAIGMKTGITSTCPALPPQAPVPDVVRRTPVVLVALGVAGLVWLLAAVVLFTDAGDGGLLSLALIGSGLLLGALWLASIQILLCTQTEQHGPWSRWAWAWALAVPLAGALGFALACTDADLALRVWLCEPSLQRHAATTAPYYSPTGEWVGFFQVEELQTAQGSFALYTGTEGMYNRAGIAYVPPGSEPPPGVRIRSHLYGNWYRFWWKF
jgi:hypothetical protein